MNKSKNDIHKGHHYHNDCEHSNDEYAFSMEIRLGNGNKLPFDVYLHVELLVKIDPKIEST